MDDPFDGWHERMQRAEDYADRMRDEFCKLAIEPCTAIPKVGDRVLVAAGLLGMGHLWVREECEVLACGDTSYKVRFLNYKPVFEPVGSKTEWVHQALITDAVGANPMSKTKRYPCPECGKRFKTKNARRQHVRDVHTRLADVEDVGKEGAKAVLDEVGADLPDGAYFALADDLGLDVDDLI